MNLKLRVAGAAFSGVACAVARMIGLGMGGISTTPLRSDTASPRRPIGIGRQAERMTDELS